MLGIFPRKEPELNHLIASYPIMADAPFLPSYLQTTTNYYQPLEPSSFDIELLLGEMDHQTDAQSAETGIYMAPQINPPNHFTMTNFPGDAAAAAVADKASRKREIDRKYRAKMKQEKMQIKTNMDKLIIQNESLKQQNASQARTIDQLTSDVDKLELKCHQQNALIQTLSEQLACRDLQLENQRLKFENAQLRHNPTLNHHLPNFGDNIEDLENFKLLRRLDLKGCHNSKQQLQDGLKSVIYLDKSPKSTLNCAWNEEQEEEE